MGKVVPQGSDEGGYHQMILRRRIFLNMPAGHISPAKRISHCEAIYHLPKADITAPQGAKYLLPSRRTSSATDGLTWSQRVVCTPSASCSTRASDSLHPTLRALISAPPDKGGSTFTREAKLMSEINQTILRRRIFLNMPAGHISPAKRISHCEAIYHLPKADITAPQAQSMSQAQKNEARVSLV